MVPAADYGMKRSILNTFSLTKPVVLIGMMGAGKTSVGRALADLLSVPFFDSDAEIEAAAGCSVAQIFADYGEDEFRRLERQVTIRLLGGDVCVLSLGGGAFVDDETRERVKKTAFSVWIKVDRDILLKRVAHHGHRPLLKGGSPKERLEKILAERESVYAEADLTVFCDDRPVLQNAYTIMTAIQDARAFRTE
jgi:shikimate kinase